jgi:hypothetical protein
LDDPLVGYQLNISSVDHPSKTRERAAGFSADLGWRAAAKGTELMGIKEHFVDAPWARREDSFLMDVRHFCSSPQMDLLAIVNHLVYHYQ